MKVYNIISEKKTGNLYKDPTETFHVVASKLSEAIKLGRKNCKLNETKFISARLKR